MVTGTMTTEIRLQDMPQLAENPAFSGLKREVLRFWRKYPFAKFASGIVAGAVACNRKMDVEEALECLVQAELLEKHVQQGLSLYRLTNEPSQRQRVLDLPTETSDLRPLFRRA